MTALALSWCGARPMLAVKAVVTGKTRKWLTCSGELRLRVTRQLVPCTGLMKADQLGFGVMN